MKTIHTMKKTLLAMMAVATLLLNACKPDDDKGNPAPPAGKKGVLVLNEGGFGKGNASLDFYDPSTNTLSENLFTGANSRPLGDVLQSVIKVGNNLYLVVNNSNKIEVVNAETYTSVATISNLGSPRYMLSPSASAGSKAYVTDLSSNKIHIINMASNTESGSIAVNGWTENLVEANGKVYVNNWTTKRVYLIDPATDMFSDSIELTGSPNGIVKDKNGKLWVLVDSAGTNNAKLQRINPANNSTEASIEFPAGQNAFKLDINAAGDKLYFLAGAGVYEVDITATALPAVAKKSGFFYGLGLDPSDGSLYLADPLDFNQKGQVYRIKTDGTESNFKAGIVPNGFYFLN